MIGERFQIMRTKYWPVICTLWLAVISVWADTAPASTNLYQGDMWKLVDLKKTMAAADEITLTKYPDCDEATVET